MFANRRILIIIEQFGILYLKCILRTPLLGMNFFFSFQIGYFCAISWNSHI